ncbi:MAG TPA: alpha/beta hydrolase-fold protein [Candidatus Dormibacteraeota bacterium]|jgi:S-formylglutathione hydrolase FrmB|nr:alpha/beta hydrolase-fold protein [Candidatus Dormibacteraeota bacterium]
MTGPSLPLRPARWRTPPAQRGRVVEDAVDSAALRDNPLGDPARRTLYVWLPPAYQDDTEQRFPVIYVLPGYGSGVEEWCNHELFEPTVFERLDVLYAADDAPPPCIVAFLDAATAYGGSQMVNSSATGRYQDYIAADVVAHVDATYRTLRGPQHRALSGHSSGGVGALVLAMRRPDVFGACASHAGDALFEHCYGRELGDFARALQEHGNDVVALRDRLLGDDQYRRRTFGPLMVLGCAAAYSPDPDAPLGIGLPIDGWGRIVPRNWERWLANDPVRLVQQQQHADALRGLRAIHLDAGDGDEYYMDLGARALHEALDNLGVVHRYERFGGRHGGISYRYPIAWEHLARALAG